MSCLHRLSCGWQQCKQAACKMRYFHIGVLCYVAVEYALWISGCLWPGYSISAPYCWLDLLLTGCLFALLPATGKAVQT